MTSLSAKPLIVIRAIFALLRKWSAGSSPDHDMLLVTGDGVGCYREPIFNLAPGLRTRPVVEGYCVSSMLCAFGLRSAAMIRATEESAVMTEYGFLLNQVICRFA